MHNNALLAFTPITDSSLASIFNTLLRCLESQCAFSVILLAIANQPLLPSNINRVQVFVWQYEVISISVY